MDKNARLITGRYDPSFYGRAAALDRDAAYVLFYCWKFKRENAPAFY
jgi:hypothetical protein